MELWATAKATGGPSGRTDQKKKGNRGRGQRQGAQSEGQGPKQQGKVNAVEASVSAAQGGKQKGQSQP